MMAVPQWTEAQLASWLEHQAEDDQPWLENAQRLTERWLARGDGVAIYENHDLGHPELGAGRLLSYGSPSAQIEAAWPPDRMPDMPGEINWRYVLIATCTRPVEL